MAAKIYLLQRSPNGAMAEVSNHADETEATAAAKGRVEKGMTVTMVTAVKTFAPVQGVQVTDEATGSTSIMQ